ncbi:MAG: MarR family transcriptional regulator [Acidimicrobiia bacterium]|nr:MarR family transcriptional regulator [Acidimicrobiia bacterium]MYF84777.1 MarR family transcriptional regulator [Acidimicrobiia bacterium]
MIAFDRNRRASTGARVSEHETRDQTEDIIDRKIRRWERTLRDNSLWGIEPAARIEQLAADLAGDMDRIAITEGLANQGDYQVLALLRNAQHREESVTPTDAAQQLGMTTATMVSRVDRLEQNGYARRVRHPADRRAVNLVITRVGIATAERMVRRRTEDRRRRLAVLTSDERNDLTVLLRKLAECWSVTDEPPQPA